jgi:thioredoxin reductase (NADPH)
MTDDIIANSDATNDTNKSSLAANKDAGSDADQDIYDVAIIGAGPAGLTAAIYLARARYRVLVLEKSAIGGQITITADVVNYPGVLTASGAALTQTMYKQAINFGAEFQNSAALSLNLSGKIKEVQTSQGAVRALAVLLATGAQPRQLGFAGEETFKGHGVAYCATCDGEFFTGLDVFVVGGGFAAAEEAVFLTTYARKVTVVMRGEDFSCAKSLADAARRHSKIEVLTHTVVEEVGGDGALRFARFRNTKTGDAWEYRPPAGESFGVFVFAGYTPKTELVKGLLELDEQGYVITDANRKTSMDGVYAAGDICVKRLRQVVTATADGAIAATELEHYANQQRAQLGIVPQLPVAASGAGGAGVAQTGAGRVGAAHAGAGGAVAAEAGAGGAGAAHARAAEASESFFSAEIQEQLQPLFAKMEAAIELKLQLDDRPISEELRVFMTDLASLSDKLSVNEVAATTGAEAGSDTGAETGAETGSNLARLPVTRLIKHGQDTGIAFHGVPGGHEFNSFVLGLYNAAGPGQALSSDILTRIAAIKTPSTIRILVSLSCTMCPDAVVATYQIAARSPLINTEVYDIAHFPDLRQKYQAMSVPCIVITGSGNETSVALSPTGDEVNSSGQESETVSFGRRDIAQMLELLGV